MTTVLTGDNSFEIERAAEAVVRAFDGTAERIDGSELDLAALPGLLMGMSLFAQKRLVIIKNLSDNKALWPLLADWLPRVSDDVELVLVEPKPDKRTKTYKDLQKFATIKEYKAWGERDERLAQQWAVDEAKRQGFILDPASAKKLVERTGADQWRVFHALEKLAVLERVTPELIDQVIELTPRENVFMLVETALKGDRAAIHSMVTVLERTEDPYKVFGLITSQVIQLATLIISDDSTDKVAKDIGAHPYVLSKLARYTGKLDRKDAHAIIEIFAEADMTLKSSAAKPWQVIEFALVAVAAR